MTLPPVRNPFVATFLAAAAPSLSRLPLYPPGKKHTRPQAPGRFPDHSLDHSLARSLAVAALTALAALAGPSMPAAHAGDLEGSDFASGNWAGRAWLDDDDGTLVDCYVSVSYANGEALTLSLTPDDGITVYLSVPGVTFTPGQAYSASLMTEVGLPVHGTAFSPNRNYIGFSLRGIDASTDFLTQGAYLRLMGVGADQSFDVRGMGGALAQARACLVTQMANEAAAMAGKPVASAPETAAPALGAAPADPAAAGAEGETDAAAAGTAPEAPAQPVLGVKPKSALPAQLGGDAATFKRQHLPCAQDCK